MHYTWPSEEVDLYAALSSVEADVVIKQSYKLVMPILAFLKQVILLEQLFQRENWNMV